MGGFRYKKDFRTSVDFKLFLIGNCTQAGPIIHEKNNYEVTSMCHPACVAWDKTPEMCKIVCFDRRAKQQEEIRVLNELWTSDFILKHGITKELEVVNASDSPDPNKQLVKLSMHLYGGFELKLIN